MLHFLPLPASSSNSRISRSFSRPLRNALVSGRVNLMIGQPLAGCALDGAFGAHGVINAKLYAVAHPEIELVQIAGQMGRAHMLVNPNQTALKQAEIAFCRIGVDAPIIAIAGEHLV